MCINYRVCLGIICLVEWSSFTLLLSNLRLEYLLLQHFEDFVRGHFYKRAHDILVACKAYINGAQVGSLVEGGVQDLELSDKSCSDNFKQSVTHLLSQLVEAFKGIGVSDCDKYLQPLPPPVSNARKRSGRHSKAQLE